MPDTTRRVNVTLTFATDDVPADVAYSVMAAVRDVSRYAHDLESISVHAFDLAENDDAEPRVQLVVDAVAGIMNTYVDRPERADEQASNIGGVVVSLPIEADHRHDEVGRDV